METKSKRILKNTTQNKKKRESIKSSSDLILPSTSKGSGKRKVCDDNENQKEDMQENESNKKIKCDYKNFDNKAQLDVEMLVAKKCQIDINVSQKIINFLRDDSTIPYLVRYKSKEINNMSAEELRFLKDAYENGKKVIGRSLFLKNKLQKDNLLTKELSYHLSICESLNELEDLYEPFKATKNSRMQIANKLGLINNCRDLLQNKSTIILQDFIDANNPLVKDIDSVKNLLIYVIGDLMAKDIDLTKNLSNIYKYEPIFIECKRNSKIEKKDSNKETNTDSENFANYYNFKRHYKSVRPHQILAINRGERLKNLKVSVLLPDSLTTKINQFCSKKWLNTSRNIFIYNLITSAIQEAVKKIEKKIKTIIRAELTVNGENEAIKVFASNLKYLLLTQPVNNKIVLAIDPGYKNGCKIAIVSNDQEILHSSILYLNKSDEFSNKLKNLICNHNVTLIAIGNGKGCRDVENHIANLIGYFKKDNIDIRYTIVSEQGLSIFSVSENAIKEYAELTPNIISAVSLAKRVINPLSEFIKVNPKNLGIGMYQHDLNHKRLEMILSEVITEVVSLVGVNLNTASLSLLSHVAGLSMAKAKSIINYRNKNGLFTERKQLLNIKGVGNKTFQQCAGFVRILPSSNESKIVEPLDQTIVHPDDYDTASRFIEEICGEEKINIGKEGFIKNINTSVNILGIPKICEIFGIEKSTIDLFINALTKPICYDIRMNGNEQLFQKKIRKFEDLRINQETTGRIENVTPFGAFVDIGIGNTVFLPNGIQFKNENIHYGQKILIKISNINVVTKKVQITLKKVV